MPSGLRIAAEGGRKAAHPARHLSITVVHWQNGPKTPPTAAGALTRVGIARRRRERSSRGTGWCSGAESGHRRDSTEDGLGVAGVARCRILEGAAARFRRLGKGLADAGPQAEPTPSGTSAGNTRWRYIDRKSVV